LLHRGLFVGFLVATVLLPGMYRTAHAQGTPIRADLSSPAMLDKWLLDGGGDWKIEDGTLVLISAGALPSEITVHRPFAVAILRTDPYRRVTFETELRLTAPLTSVRRDLTVVFGYESPTRFYYAHFGGITDAGNNGIFLVDNADRRRLDPPTPEPLLTDQNWHRVRLERDGSTGRIDVFFDDAAAPVFSAVDTTIPSGQVGVGTLNDYGEFRNIVVTGAPD
jgi:hypothetical protein